MLTKKVFLRNNKSLTQTVGRAARNVNGLAIMYADKVTKSMQSTMDETDRRREIQIAYNTKHNKVPTQINKKIEDTLTKSAVSSYHYDNAKQVAAEQELHYLPKEEIEKRIRQKRKQMEAAAKGLDFIVAAKLRDEIKVLKEQV